MSRSAFDLRSVLTAAILGGEDPVTLDVSQGLLTVRRPSGGVPVPPTHFKTARRLTVAANAVSVSDAGIVVPSGGVDIIVLWEHVTSVGVGRLLCMMLPEPVEPSTKPPRRVGRFVVHNGGR